MLGLIAAWQRGVSSVEPGNRLVMVVSLAVIVLGCLSAWYFWKRLAQLGTMRRLRLVTTDEAIARATPDGPYVSLYGIAMTTDPLVSPATGTRCVYYRYLVEEYINDPDERARQESELQVGEGVRLVSSRRGWTVIEDDIRGGYFQVKDTTGSITVDMRGAEVIGLQTVDGKQQTSGADDPVGRAASILTHGASRDGQQRVSEWIIPLGQPVYIMGPIVQDGSTTVIQAVETKDFVITQKSRTGLAFSFKLESLWWLAAACLLVPGGVLAVVYAASGKPVSDQYGLWKNAYPFVYLGLIIFAVLFASCALTLFAWSRKDGKSLKSAAAILVEQEMGLPAGEDPCDTWALEGMKLKRCPNCASRLPPGSTNCHMCGWQDESQLA
jgi:hypothetical protein